MRIYKTISHANSINGSSCVMKSIDKPTLFVNMCLFKICIFLLFLIVSHCYALSCRSEHGKKEEEIRRAFSNCKNKMNNNSNSSEDSRNRSYNYRNQWDYENRDSKNRDMGNRNNWMGNRQRNEDTNDRYDKMLNRNGNENAANRMDDRWNLNNRNDWSNMNGFDNGSGGNRNENYGMSRNDMNNYSRNDQITGRDEFLHSEELNGDFSRPQQRNNHYTPPQSSRRYKREKRVEINSGQRSQYNPHSQRTNNNDNNSNRNSSNNSTKEVEKACLLHCVLETLQVTDDNGMPDRYLMTHSFTKDKTNEDVRDFVQESIEECYQLADNENTEDKCEFSKNLITCFMEKERGNCDDFNEMNGYLLE